MNNAFKGIGETGIPNVALTPTPELVTPPIVPINIHDISTISKPDIPPINISGISSIPKPPVYQIPDFKIPSIPEPNRKNISIIIDKPFLPNITKINLPQIHPVFPLSTINAFKDIGETGIPNIHLITAPELVTPPIIPINIHDISTISKPDIQPIIISGTSSIPKLPVYQIPDFKIPTIPDPNRKNISRTIDKPFLPNITKINLPQIHPDFPLSTINALKGTGETGIPNVYLITTPELVTPPIIPTNIHDISTISKPDISPIYIPGLSSIPKPSVYQIPEIKIPTIPEPNRKNIAITIDKPFLPNITKINLPQIHTDFPLSVIGASKDIGETGIPNIPPITTPELVTPPIIPINIHDISTISKPDISPINISGISSIPKPPVYQIPDLKIPTIPEPNHKNISITIDKPFLPNITKINLPQIHPIFPLSTINAFKDIGETGIPNIHLITAPELATPPIIPINIHDISTVSKPDILPINIPSISLTPKPPVYQIPGLKIPTIPDPNRKNISIAIDKTFLPNITKINLPQILPVFPLSTINAFKDIGETGIPNIHLITTPELVTPPIIPINIHDISTISKPDIQPIIISGISPIPKLPVYQIPDLKIPTIPDPNRKNIPITIDKPILPNITKINLPKIRPDFPLSVINASKDIGETGIPNIPPITTPELVMPPIIPINIHDISSISKPDIPLINISGISSIPKPPVYQIPDFKIPTIPEPNHKNISITIDKPFLPNITKTNLPQIHPDFPLSMNNAFKGIGETGIPNIPLLTTPELVTPPIIPVNILDISTISKPDIIPINIPSISLTPKPPIYRMPDLKIPTIPDPNRKNISIAIDKPFLPNITKINLPQIHPVFPLSTINAFKDIGETGIPNIPLITTPELVTPPIIPINIHDISTISKPDMSPINIPSISFTPKPPVYQIPDLKIPTIPDPNRKNIPITIVKPFLPNITKINLPQIHPHFKLSPINASKDIDETSIPPITTPELVMPPIIPINIHDISTISKPGMSPINIPDIIDDITSIPKPPVYQIPDLKIPTIPDPNRKNITITIDKRSLPNITKINLPQIHPVSPLLMINASKGIGETGNPNVPLITTPELVTPPIIPINIHDISTISKPDIPLINISGISAIPKPPVYQIPDFKIPTIPDPNHKNIPITIDKPFLPNITKINLPQIHPVFPLSPINASKGIGETGIPNIPLITTPELVTPSIIPINIHDISTISKPGISPINIPGITSIPKPPVYQIPDLKIPTIPYPNRKNITVTTDKPFLPDITQINLPQITKPDFPPININAFRETGGIGIPNIPNIPTPELVTPPLKAINIRDVSNISKPAIPKPPVYQKPQLEMLKSLTKAAKTLLTLQKNRDSGTPNIPDKSTPELFTPTVIPINIQDISNISKQDILPVNIPGISSIPKPPVYQIPDLKIPTIPDPTRKNITVPIDKPFLPDITKINLPQITKPDFPPININTLKEIGNIGIPNIPAITTPKLVTPPLKPINIHDISNINKPDMSPINIPGISPIPKLPVYQIPDLKIPTIPDPNRKNITVTIDKPFLPDITKINLPQITKPDFPPININTLKEIVNIGIPNIPAITTPKLVTPPLKPINIHDISNINKPDISPINSPGISSIPKLPVYQIPDLKIPTIPDPNLKNITITIDKPFLPNITKINLPQIHPVFPLSPINAFKGIGETGIPNVPLITTPELVTPPIIPINIHDISTISKPGISPINVPGIPSIPKPPVYQIPDLKIPTIPDPNRKNITVTIDKPSLPDIKKLICQK
ncbi:mucin-2-like [Macrobrachium rosenbergii]|uniref:mucin-2-like n=1 Tax=Macrobrachium rosenbergii TaxID=79674 RepID=UPI0034D55203